MNRPSYVRIGLAFALWAPSAFTWAGAFAIPEQSASGTGTAFSGAAASAEDASTIWFNPAGMPFLEGRQMVNGLSVVYPSTSFTNGSSVAAPGQPLGQTDVGIGQTGYIPFIYVAAPITKSKDLWVGLGINAPFGLKTEYPGDWVGRFQGIKSESSALTANLAAAWRVNDQLSLAAGFDAQHFKAELTNAVNYTAIVAQAAGQAGLALPPIPGLAGRADVQGDDWGYGYNLGALLEFAKDARIGVSYRSAISYRVEGSINFDRPAAPANLPPPVQSAVNQIIAGATPNGPVHVDVKLPPMAMLSGTVPLSNKLLLLGDVTWTGWDTLQSINIVRDSAGPPLPAQPYGYKNVWRYSLGARYELNKALWLRAGVAYDQSPVPDALRNVRLPDADKTWLATGIRYQPTSCPDFSPSTATKCALTFDLGYAYVFARDVSIDYSQPGAGVVNGSYRSHVQLLSGQVGFAF